MLPALTGLALVAALLSTGATCRPSKAKPKPPPEPSVIIPTPSIPRPFAVDKVGEALGESAFLADAIDALQRLERSDDPAERILRATFCEGMEQLLDYESDDPETTFSADAWRSFLIDAGESWAVDVVGEAVPSIAIESAVNDFMTGIELAEVNAAAARFYVNACVRA